MKNIFFSVIEIVLILINQTCKFLANFLVCISN
jgi:hypothetical protein